jgi:ubiquinone/menaquinone biosynthesis C-methylase UbiE
MAQYGKPEYWDERYTRDPEPFDWYQRYENLKGIIRRYIRPNENILMVGCGNSRMSEEMANDSFQRVVNIDISNVVIGAMNEKHRNNPHLTFRTMDVMKMDFRDGEFDAIVDKATMDAVLCGDNSIDNIKKMFQEIYRTLKPGGVYIVITYGAPDARLSHFQEAKLGWKVEIETVPKAYAELDKEKPNDVHYVYIATKNPIPVGANIMNQ